MPSNSATRSASTRSSNSSLVSLQSRFTERSEWEPLTSIDQCQGATISPADPHSLNQIVPLEALCRKSSRCSEPRRHLPQPPHHSFKLLLGMEARKIQAGKTHIDQFQAWAHGECSHCPTQLYPSKSTLLPSRSDQNHLLHTAHIDFKPALSLKAKNAPAL